MKSVLYHGCWHVAEKYKRNVFSDYRFSIFAAFLHKTNDYAAHEIYYNYYFYDKKGPLV
jgi:hypothetical protein